MTVTDTEAIRKVVRALVLPGQRRIHMKHEQARRRRIIVSALAATEVRATVYDAARRYPTDLAARTACLTSLVQGIAARGGDTRLVIEQDDSVVRPDRHDLFQLARQAGIADRLEYTTSAPTTRVAALSARPADLRADLNLFGLLFESLVVRDLRIYAQPAGAEVRTTATTPAWRSTRS